MSRIGDWLLLLTGAAVMVWWLCGASTDGCMSRRAPDCANWRTQAVFPMTKRLHCCGNRVSRYYQASIASRSASRLTTDRTQQTRLYFDYLAVKEDKYYLGQARIGPDSPSNGRQADCASDCSCMHFYFRIVKGSSSRTRRTRGCTRCGFKWRMARNER